MTNIRRALILAVLIAGGCQGDSELVNQQVDAGEVALGGNRYDVAIFDAGEALRLHPNPQAYYLRARAQEDRPKPDDLITAADMDKARADYQAALELHPAKPLAARCHVGLANVAFSKADYALAIFHWTTALDDLEQPQWRAQALYGVGQAQQRLGRFDDADKTLNRVRQEYPDQDASSKALTSQGIRAFYVQIGAFTNISDAQKAAQAAETAGLPCKQAADQGLVAVRSGPYSTYADAQRAKATVATQFPGATIGPVIGPVVGP